MKAWNIPYTVLCPSLPVNGRTVKDGILYVNGVPLAESPMRNHPLTPMRDSRLVNLMEMQSEFPAKVVGSSSMVAAGSVAPGKPCYLIPVTRPMRWRPDCGIFRKLKFSDGRLRADRGVGTAVYEAVWNGAGKMRRCICRGTYGHGGNAG